MSNRIAHDLNSKWRSDDVIINEEKNFSSLHLDERILTGLSKAGFKIPSPVQLEAIPLCQTGSDVFVQGKAGTGKTLVFSILALTTVLETEGLQVLIVAPTREAAVQIHKTITAIGCKIKDLNCEYFIGGISYHDDISAAETCNIAVGTPGRILHLVEQEKLKIDTLRLFVIDDIDELPNKNSGGSEVSELYDALPATIQTVVTSLTCTDEVVQLATEFLKHPYLGCYCEKALPSLLGMAHYYHIVPFDFLRVLGYRVRLAILKDVLLRVKFSQCIIFCNYVHRVELLRIDIQNCGLSIASMTNAMDQVERLQVLELLKKNKCKIFITTDIASRGLDAENVDLVVNFDMPSNNRTYLYRCGRAGRYGGKCASITFLGESQKNLLIELENENFETYALSDVLNCDINPSKLTSLPCKPPSSGCNAGENCVPSLTELSKIAVINLPSLLSGEENAQLPVNLENFTVNQLNMDFGNKAFNKEHDIKNCEESSCKTAHTPYRNELTGECAKENVVSSSDFPNVTEILESSSRHDSDALSSECKPLPLDNCENLIVSSSGKASETEIKQYLKKTDNGNECSSFKKIDLFSASRVLPKSTLKIKSTSKTSKDVPKSTLKIKSASKSSKDVPKSTLKIKSTSKTSKDVPHKEFDEMHLEREGNRPKNVTRIPQVTRKKKICNESIEDVCNKKPSRLANCGPRVMKPTSDCKGKMKSREREVMFCGLKTTSKSATNQSGIKCHSATPANHSDKKICGKRLHGYDNHSYTSHLNAQGNFFPGRNMSPNGHCSCCNSRPCCPSSQFCSFPNYYYQHPFLAHRDMFYQQWKFINDFAYFLSYNHP